MGAVFPDILSQDEHGVAGCDLGQSRDKGGALLHDVDGQIGEPLLSTRNARIEAVRTDERSEGEICLKRRPGRTDADTRAGATPASPRAA